MPPSTSAWPWKRQNSTVVQTIQNVYLCPSDPLPGGTFPVTDSAGNVLAFMGPTSYAACVGNDFADTTTGLNNDGQGNGVLFRNSAVRMAAITDGASQTIVVAERLVDQQRPVGRRGDERSHRPGAR